MRGIGILQRAGKWRGKVRGSWFSGTGCAVAGGVLFLVGVVVYFVLGQLLVHSIDKSVAKAEQRVRDAGQPLTLEELDAYYRAVPDEKNAALIYERAFEALDAVDPDGKTVDALLNNYQWSRADDESLPKVQAEATDFLDGCKEVVALLSKASTLPGARYPVNLAEYDLETFPHYNWLMRCAKLQEVRSANAIVAGRQWEFVESQESIVHMAKTLRQEPDLGSQISRSALLGTGLLCINDAARLASLDPKTLAALETFYSEPEDSEPLARCLAGERCVQVAALKTRLQSEGLTPLERVLKHVDPVTQYTVRHNRQQHRYRDLLRGFADLIRVMDKPWEDRVAYVTELMEHGTGWRENIESPKHPLHYAVWGIHYMALGAAVSRIGRVAVAVERYWSDNNELPENLERLVPTYIPEVPIDPFDGQPLRYVLLEDGYAIYSVYFDGIDDGGAPPEHVSEMEWTGDWVFVVRW